jgi:hypothetical protein
MSDIHDQRQSDDPAARPPENPVGSGSRDGEEVPLETAPEIGADDLDDEQDALSESPTARALRKTVADAAGIARDSAAGVVRGSTAATRGGAALAERAVHVTYWPALLCVLGAILLQVSLPGKLTVGPAWLLPSLEGALLIALAVTTQRGRAQETHLGRRRAAIGLIALVNAANAVSLYLLAHELLHKHVSNGPSLIRSGIAIWLTNVLIFALWYWQLDRGGPANRARHPDPKTPEGRPDFVFPEMDTGKEYIPDSWLPSFVDYVALAFTTGTAFSPTDAMPISSRAKALMVTQGTISLVTLGLIISRAVNILS